MLITISTQGTRTILPAIVVGYQNIPGVCVDYSRAPEWVTHLEFQTGGYSTGISDIAGIVLRLVDNFQPGFPDGPEVVNIFRCMAEDPDISRGVEMMGESFRSLVLTFGEQYEVATQLRRLQMLANRFSRMPEFLSGREALLECGPIEPLQFFRDWKITSFKNRENPNLTYIDATSWSDSSMSVEQTLTTELMITLHGLKMELGVTRDLETFLVWENSD